MTRVITDNMITGVFAYNATFMNINDTGDKVCMCQGGLENSISLEPNMKVAFHDMKYFASLSH